MDCGPELHRARADVLLLFLVFSPEQKVVHHPLQAGGSDHHNYANLADGCTLVLRSAERPRFRFRFRFLAAGSPLVIDMYRCTADVHGRQLFGRLLSLPRGAVRALLSAAAKPLLKRGGGCLVRAMHYDTSLSDRLSGCTVLVDVAACVAVLKEHTT